MSVKLDAMAEKALAQYHEARHALTAARELHFDARKALDTARGIAQAASDAVDEATFTMNRKLSVFDDHLVRLLGAPSPRDTFTDTPVPGGIDMVTATPEGPFDDAPVVGIDFQHGLVTHVFDSATGEVTLVANEDDE